jgi:hypothetical protein
MLMKPAAWPGIRCEDNTKIRHMEIVFEMDEAGTESRWIRSMLAMNIRALLLEL